MWSTSNLWSSFLIQLNFQQLIESFILYNTNPLQHNSHSFTLVALKTQPIIMNISWRRNKRIFSLHTRPANVLLSLSLLFRFFIILHPANYRHIIHTIKVIKALSFSCIVHFFTSSSLLFFLFFWSWWRRKNFFILILR